MNVHSNNFYNTSNIYICTSNFIIDINTHKQTDKNRLHKLIIEIQSINLKKLQFNKINSAFFLL